MKITKEQQREIERLVDYTKRGLNEFLEIFLTNKEENPNSYKLPSKNHYIVSDMLLNQRENMAIQGHREFGKTSIMQSYLLHRIVYPVKEDTYIVLIKQNQRLAEEKLRELIATYKGNPFFKMYNLIKIVRESQRVFEVIVIDEKKEEHNIRIEAYGKGSSIRGLLYGNKRPSTIACDDLQDFEDSLSRITMEKDWEWYLSDVRGLGVNTKIFMIGNNLGSVCLIERIFEASKELGFKIFRIPALTLNEKGEEVSGWEEMFSTEYLIKEKEDFAKMNKLDVWYRERLCLAISEENQVFKQEYLQRYRICPVFKEIVTAVDPAISQKSGSDYTAIVTIGVAPNNHIFVLNIVRKRLLPDEIIAELFSAVKMFNPSRVGVEDVQFQRMLILEIRKQMTLRNSFFMLEPLRPMGDKESRIKSILQARYASMTVFHNNESETAALEDELLSFPKGLHDDIIDALAYCVKMLEVASLQTKEYNYIKNTEDRFESDFDEIFGHNEKVLSYKVPSFR